MIFRSPLVYLFSCTIDGGGGGGVWRQYSSLAPEQNRAINIVATIITIVKALYELLVSIVGVF